MASSASPASGAGGLDLGHGLILPAGQRRANIVLGQALLPRCASETDPDSTGQEEVDEREGATEQHYEVHDYSDYGGYGVPLHRLPAHLV